MCLIAWNWQPDSEMPLLVLANRDEFYARPTRPLHWWEDGRVLAGKDLQAGGTWLGLSHNGRFAALTNYRMPSIDPGARPSRGALVADFLQGDGDATAFLNALKSRADDYNPFNLVVFDGLQLMGIESRNKRVFSIAPGISAVSNADFDTPWPKLLRLKQRLQTQCLAGRTDVSDLLPLLHDDALSAESDLPQTGVALELERMLSAIFIRSANYGTRACSVVAVQRNELVFFEQCHNVHGLLTSVQHSLTR
jgi:uncharacterized protein with NRDE domain